MAQVVRTHGSDPGLRECWLPDLDAEPVAGDVAVGVPGAGPARVIHTERSPLGPISGERALAVPTSATPGRIGAQRSVPVGAPPAFGCVRLRSAERVRIRQHDQLRDSLLHSEDRGVVRQALSIGMRFELASDAAGQLETAVLPVLRVLLDEEPAAGWVELGVHLHHGPANGQHPGCEVEVPHPQLGELTLAQAGLDLGLGQQAHRVVGQRAVDAAELLRRDDRPRLLRHRGCLDALAGVDDTT